MDSRYISRERMPRLFITKSARVKDDARDFVSHVDYTGVGRAGGWSFRSTKGDKRPFKRDSAFT